MSSPDPNWRTKPRGPLSDETKKKIGALKKAWWAARPREPNARRDKKRQREKEWRARTGRSGRTWRAKMMGAPPEALTQRTCDACGCVSEKTPHLDHDHTTGKFRGVLCYGCNVSLGSLGEDPERIERLAAYARRIRGT